MALKTRESDGDVAAFLAAVTPERRRADAHAMLEMMGRVTAAPPRMWGASMVGFGSYSYLDAKKKPARWMRTGFSPRKSALTVYIMCGLQGLEPFVERIGPVKTSVSCVYVTNLAKVDAAALEDLIRAGWERMNALHPDD